MFCSNYDCIYAARGETLNTANEGCPRCDSRLVYRAVELLGESDIQIVPETRQSQVDMAKEVEYALFDDHHLAIEAGVGTGKTFAYLVPAIQHADRILVSTATKNLQDQIISNDIPYLQKKLSKLLSKPFTYNIFKGQGNYLCWKDFNKHKNKLDKEDQEEVLKYLDESGGYNLGETAEFKDVPVDVRRNINKDVSASGCIGDNCPKAERCPYHLLNTSNPNIQVANHAYVMHKYRRNTRWLEQFDVIIIDEAHRFDEFTRKAFMSTCDIDQYRDFIDTLDDEARFSDNANESRIKKLKTPYGRLDEDGNGSPRIEYKCYTSESAVGPRDVLERAKTACDRIEDYLAENTPPYDTRIGSEAVKRLYRDNEQSWRDIMCLISSVVAGIKSIPQKKDQFKIKNQARDFTSGIKHLLEENKARVTYVHSEQRPRYHKKDYHKTIRIEPVFSAPYVRSMLENNEVPPTIFTSATMSQNGRMFTFERDLGLNALGENTYQRKCLGSNYDYKNNVQVYIEDDPALEPKRSGNVSEYNQYIQNLCNKIKALADVTNGRSFVLFTSYKDTSAVYNQLKGETDYPLFRQQRHQSPDDILQDYLEAIENGQNPVLLGTKSFWHGVSIEGDKLKQVIIAKAPFPNPGDPVIEGKSSLFDTTTFKESKPEMIRSFEQGAGRLIRTNEDKGILSILDARMATKRWGENVKGALPMIYPDENVYRLNQLEDPYGGDQ